MTAKPNELWAKRMSADRRHADGLRVTTNGGYNNASSKISVKGVWLMQEKLGIFPVIEDGFIIARDSDVMTGFKNINEALAVAVDILAGRAEFVRGLDMRDVKIDRTGVRAVLSRTDSSIEERRFTTEKDGTITVEEYEHPV